jgi:putative phosphoesterase
VRVAAIYDIHGNLPALEAALTAIDSAAVDLIVVGGDIAWGPLPRETMGRLLTLGDRACFIRGDADRDILESMNDEPDPDDEAAAESRWCAEELTDEQLAFLAQQRETLAIDIDGLEPTLFCHGSPRSDRDRITMATPAAKVLPMLAGVSERVIVCGHTHAQFDRSVGDYRVVNAGSVGLQFRRPRRLLGDLRSGRRPPPHRLRL